MLKLISNNPLITSILFLMSFEYMFQYNMFFILYVIVIYVALKTLGVTKIMKAKAYDLFMSILTKKEFIPIEDNLMDFTQKQPDGSIEGIFEFVRDSKKYMVNSSKSQAGVKIRVIDMKNQKNPKTFNVQSFFVTRNTMEKFLNEHYFNSL